VKNHLITGELGLRTAEKLAILEGGMVELPEKVVAATAFRMKFLFLKLSEEVKAQYDPSKERIQEPNYWLDLKLRKLKPCL